MFLETLGECFDGAIVHVDNEETISETQEDHKLVVETERGDRNREEDQGINELR